MSPFEDLYGRTCNVPVNWEKPMEWVIIGLEMLKDLEEQIRRINHNLKIPPDIQKIYTDGGRRLQ